MTGYWIHYVQSGIVLIQDSWSKSKTGQFLEIIGIKGVHIIHLIKNFLLNII